MKKRILWIDEASFLNTGFAVLSKEILQRLYATDKYEIAEYGSYVSTNDPRSYEVPWEFYASIPDQRDEYWTSRYNQSVYGQFGATLFEQVCLNFTPDICIDQRDAWMSTEWTLKSPFRPYFKYIIGPTVDGSPQKIEWIEDYLKTDMVLTYSEYGKKTLETESGGKIKVFDVFAPGVNHEIFKPLDKFSIRKEFSLDPDSHIIMTVMRNQKRKLYPELISMFADLMQSYLDEGKQDLFNKTYLFMHTSYPDVGYDLSRLILQSGVSNKILVTYSCQNCRKYYVDFFQSELTSCRHCGVIAAHMPNTSFGISREQLARLYGLADLYIQYSIAEGFALPIAEAKSCCIPSCGTDHTAISEQVNAPGCFPIKNGRIFYESVLETEQIRFLPDNKDAIRKIKNFFNLSKETRVKMGELARKHVLETCTMDRSAKIWEKAIDSIDILDRNKTWFAPKPRIAPLNKHFQKAGSISEFVDLCITNIIGDQSLLDSFWRNEIIKALNVGFLVTKQGRESFDFNKCIDVMMNIGKNQNNWEQIRLNKFINDKKKELQWKML